MVRWRVVILDRQRTFVDALAARLEREHDLSVVGLVPAATLDAGLIVADGADIVLLDGDLPGDAGFSLCAELTGRVGGPRVIMLSDSSEPQRIVGALRAGAAGWVRKDETVEQLLRVLRGVARGEMWLPPGELGHVLRLLLGELDERSSDDELFGVLTPRERQVAVGLAQGCGRRDVAGRLHRSWHAVRTYLQDLMARPGGACLDAGRRSPSADFPHLT